MVIAAMTEVAEMMTVWQVVGEVLMVIVVVADGTTAMVVRWY